MTSSSGLLLVFVTLAAVINAAKVPPGWKTCKRSLPPAEYDPCIYNAVKSTIDDLIVQGVPNLHIPPLEPFKIPSVVIGQGSGPVAIDINMWDVEISNFLPWQLRKIRPLDIEKYQFGADIAFEKPVSWKSKYEVNGKVLVLPINGKGDCRFQLDNYRASIDISGVPYKKGEETYMNVTDLKYSFDTDKLHLHFDNLFNGNKELSDSMNVFMNENWAELLMELKPALTEALGLSFKNVASQVFHSIPFKKIFPE